jgi:hypothetical protein
MNVVLKKRQVEDEDAAVSQLHDLLSNVPSTNVTVKVRRYNEGQLDVEFQYRNNFDTVTLIEYWSWRWKIRNDT